MLCFAGFLLDLAGASRAGAGLGLSQRRRVQKVVPSESTMAKAQLGKRVLPRLPSCSLAHSCPRATFPLPVATLKYALVKYVPSVLYGLLSISCVSEAHTCISIKPLILGGTRAPPHTAPFVT